VHYFKKTDKYKHVLFTPL